MKKIFISIGLMYFLVCSIEGKIVEKIIAAVNNDIITLTELEQQFKFYLTAKRKESVTIEEEKDIKNKLLEGMIEDKLIEQEAVAEKVGISVGEVESALKRRKEMARSEAEFEQALEMQGLTVDSYKEKLKIELMAGRLIEEQVGQREWVDDKEVEEFYKSNKEKFKESENIKLSHILIVLDANTSQDALKEANKKIEKIKGLLKQGKDFAAVAKEYSEDSGTKELGGSLGMLKREDLSPDFQKAVSNLKTGEISDAVRSPSGLHIFKLDEEMPSKQLLLLDEVGYGKDKRTLKEYIRMLLIEKRRQDKLKEWVNKLKEKSSIEIKL